MSISAIASAWSWLNGSTAAASSGTARTTESVFESSLSQWEQTSGADSQTSSAAPTQTGQPQGANGTHHHHHHHGVYMDGGESGDGSIQSALSSLISDVAGALQGRGSTTNGSGNASLQSAANTLVSAIADASPNAAATTPGAPTTPAKTSIQTAATTLATDIAQALQAYGTAPAAAGTTQLSV